MSELHVVKTSNLGNIMTMFALKQTTGAKLESAVVRNGLEEIAGHIFEWMATGQNMKLVAKLSSGECELTKVAKAVEVLLEDMESVTIDIDPAVDPSKVLKTAAATAKTEALWVDEAFATILTKKKGSFPTSVTMKPRRLKENASDLKIKRHLPKEHEIDPIAFVCMLATELTKVRSGEKSKVLSKDHWCLFYVAGLVVLVYWNSGYSKWLVSVWRQGDNTWYAELVVFSCN
jgi:hypothetical protein